MVHWPHCSASHVEISSFQPTSTTKRIFASYSFADVDSNVGVTTLLGSM